MRHKSFAVTLLLSLVVGVLSVAPAAAARARSMQEVVDAMQPGWNLGNTFDAYPGDETSWGNPRTTRELIAAVADQGYRSIRIPVTWDERVDAENRVDPAFLDRLQQVIDWALAEGLYVMINVHHDSHIWIRDAVTDRDPVVARFRAIWTQVAERFRSYPGRLVFEGLNEPRFSDDWNEDQPLFFDILDQLNTTFVHVVRSSGGDNATRPLVLSTMTGSPSQARLDALKATIDKLADPYLIATVHYYGFWPFSVNIAGYTKVNDEVRKDLTDAFRRTHDTLTANGIPVIVGEYGLLGFDKFVGTIQQGEKLKYFELVAYEARRNRFALMLWDNGQHFDRRNLRWFDPDLYAVMRAGFTGRSGNAETDSVYLRSGQPIGDMTIQLNPNGLRFSGLLLNGRWLRRDRDYTVAGSVLTLKASLLQRIATGGLGEQGVIVTRFDSGADWKLHVIKYNVPALAASSGSLAGLAIPTTFAGDALATMESRYADGSPAGPASWTPYQEFGAAFVPETGQIRLTPQFLDALQDGVVNLRFHFWSGSIVAYQVTKTGDTVQGTPA